MSGDFRITPISLPLPELEPLRREAARYGFRFLERLVADWESGGNRFDQPGERLVGAFASNRLIAVGGISRDPYLAAGNVGRLRHLYVARAHRSRGAGSAVIDDLLLQARGVFHEVRLRTDSEQAARFYLRRGFLPLIDPNASHWRGI